MQQFYINLPSPSASPLDLMSSTFIFKLSANQRQPFQILIINRKGTADTVQKSGTFGNYWQAKHCWETEHAAWQNREEKIDMVIEGD
jgi:hypothetical protein